MGGDTPTPASASAVMMKAGDAAHEHEDEHEHEKQQRLSLITAPDSPRAALTTRDEAEAPIDLVVPKRIASTTLLKGIEADRRLAHAVPLSHKVAFMLTNMPYWALAAIALGRLVDAGLHHDHHWCEKAEVYLFLSLIVAVSSTLMHGSQLRMGHHFCCGHVERSRSFHEPHIQVQLKKLDIGCAVIAALATTTCHSWTEVLVCFSVAGPAFVAGIILKRLEYHRAYLFAHGLWHIATTIPAFNAISSM